MSYPHMTVTQRFANQDTREWWERQPHRIARRLTAREQERKREGNTHVSSFPSRNMGVDL